MKVCSKCKEEEKLVISNPIVIIALHIAILVGAIGTFGPIFGGIMYALAVIMLNNGELT